MRSEIGRRGPTRGLFTGTERTARIGRGQARVRRRDQTGLAGLDLRSQAIRVSYDSVREARRQITGIWEFGETEWNVKRFKGGKVWRDGAQGTLNGLALSYRHIVNMAVAARASKRLYCRPF